MTAQLNTDRYRNYIPDTVEEMLKKLDDDRRRRDRSALPDGMGAWRATRR